MSDEHLLIDAFADVRRTWDELVAIQPDIVLAAGSGSSRHLQEFDRRLGAHREAVDRLADALEAVHGEPARGGPRRE